MAEFIYDNSSNDSRVNSIYNLFPVTVKNIFFFRISKKIPVFFLRTEAMSHELRDRKGRKDKTEQSDPNVKYAIFSTLMIMHQSFATTSPSGPGNSGDIDFSICKAQV